MMDDKLVVRVTALRQESRFAPDSLKAETTLVVEFMVGPHGPYTIDIPPGMTDKVEMLKLVEERAHAIRAILTIT